MIPSVSACLRLRRRPRSRGRVLVGLLALAAGGLVTLPGSAGAATPAAGSVSDTSPTATWSAGPFAVPNVTGTLGTPSCAGAQTCDDYALKVTVPAGYDAGHSLRIAVGWPDSAADFDLYVLGADGREVAASASSNDPETVVLPAVTASYTVRVVPFDPIGDSFTGTASLVSNPVDPPPATGTPPTYSASWAPDSIKDAHNAGEPSIGVDRATGAVMFQAYTSTLEVSYDSAGAATWSDRSAQAANGCPQGSVTSLDPILFTDPRTNRTFESQLAGKTALTCFTDDDGRTWTPTSGSGINSGVDHQSIGGGPFAPGGVGALTSYPDAVYYCSQDIVDASCASSHDGGLTYGPAVPVYSLLDCGGLHGHVKVAPDGTVYLPDKDCGGKQAVAVSQDNGLSWTARKDPASAAGDTDPSVGIGAAGTVYMGYQDGSGTARIAVSHDKGTTWVYDQNVGASLGIRNAVFPEVTAGDDSRASFAFLGTTTGGDYQSASFAGVWHLYVATTYDGGQSWITVDATPGDPVQRGPICTGGTTCGQDRNLLDFNDVTTDAQGRVLVAYADGCTGGCAAGGPENYDALATISRQTGGDTLYGAYDATARPLR